MKKIQPAVIGPFLISFALQILPLNPSVFAAPAKTNPPPKLNIQETPLARDVKAGTSFAPVIKKVAPSVVNIYSTMTVRDRTTMLDDPFFRRFFGEEGGNPRRPREHKAQSLGSGGIVSQDGYILTANH